MKRLSALFMAAVMLFSLQTLSADAATTPVKVFYNGSQMKFDVDPVIEKGTTLVEFRSLAEAFGLKVTYSPSAKYVTGSKEQVMIELAIGSNSAVVNDKTYNLQAPVTVKNGRTMVPLRFIGESTGAKVEWDGKNRVIKIDGANKK